MPDQKGQISIELSDSGKRCLVYREDTVTKTHDGGLKDMNCERKIVCVYPSSDLRKCPVRLTLKYLSLCPRYIRKPNFYLRSLEKPTPTTWYAEQVVGSQTLSKVIGKLMEGAEIQGFFTNHSARRTGSTRLFRAGVDRKIIKECTGHRSDAIDKYQVTSDAQREKVSEIICNDPQGEVEKGKDTVECNKSEANEPPVSNVRVIGQEKSDNITVESHDIGTLVNQIISSSKKQGKSTIKIQIEITNE